MCGETKRIQSVIQEGGSVMDVVESMIKEVKTVSKKKNKQDLNPEDQIDHKKQIIKYIETQPFELISHYFLRSRFNSSKTDGYVYLKDANQA